MYSGRTRSSKVDIDFKIYGTKGDKVKKQRKTLSKIMADNIELELRLVCRLDRFMVENELDMLYDVEEIEEAIKELHKIVEGYEEIHIKLKGELKDTHAETYPEYETRIKVVTEWVKSAKAEIRNKKKEQSTTRKEESEEPMEKEKATVRAEVKYFLERTNLEIHNMKLELEEEKLFIEDLERHASSCQDLFQGLMSIFIKVERLGSQFIEEFEEVYEEYYNKISTFTQDSRKRIYDSKSAKSREEHWKKQAIETEKFDREKREKIQLSKSMFDTIDERFSKMEIKCILNVSDLPDSELLYEKKQFKTIHSDFNELLDRTVKLAEIHPEEFDETKEFLPLIKTRKEKLKTLIDLFKESFEKEIRLRDLSEEKIKNASLLGIKLPKFKGYDSPLDFYTFKTEFEKLVAPQVRVTLLPEYLKNNYLEGHAFEIVKEIVKIEDIWERLQLSFGNVVKLMSKKLKDLESSVPLWLLKSDEKLISSITKIKNCMMELSSLAEKHTIETSLYHHSNLAKIFNILGKNRQTKIMKTVIEKKHDEQKTWNEIIVSLDKEIQVKEQILIFENSYSKKSEHLKNEKGKEKSLDKSYLGQSNNQDYSKTKKCLICGKYDHVPTTTTKGKSIINYFSCNKFAKMSPHQRFEELKRKNLCFQCLTPGFKSKHEGYCFDKFKCPHESHKRYPHGLHVLICDRHKNNKENLELLESYKAQCITNSDNTGTPYSDFTKNISISFHTENTYHDEINEEGESELAIYMLQTVKIGNKNFNFFYDSGCGGSIIKKNAIDLLTEQNRAEHIVPGPIRLSGVGDVESICQYGKYKFTLPLYNGKEANVSGICLDKITSVFPKYPLGKVEKDIHKAFRTSGGNPKDLPKLPSHVGGDTDVMLGIQYLKYYPKKLFELPNGLSIYKSQFLSPNGERGLVAGPHRYFSEIYKTLGNNHVRITAYFEGVAQTYKSGYQISLDTSLLGIKEHLPERNEIIFDTDTITNKRDESVETMISDLKGDNEVHVAKRAPKALKQFENVESLGTEISYRCVKCRGCADCRKSKIVELTSLQEEVEQALIEKCVKVDLEKNRTTAFLPFLCDPTTKLAPNKDIATKVYQTQVRILNKNEKDKNDVLKAEKKLQDLGFVDYVKNLTVEEQDLIFSSPLLYFLPWRAVWNGNSISTPCRPVFDASFPTKTGISLNDVLAKGTNNMNKLLEILIRWRIRRYAYHTDVKTMYNGVGVVPEHWCYQLYLFQKELSLIEDPELKVVKTAIYGVVPSGNIAERGIRQAGDLQKEEYPRQHEVISNDAFVDDVLSGEDSVDKANEVTDGLEVVLNKAGFQLKPVTMSGADPAESVSKGDNSINVAGKFWEPKKDLLRLNVGELNFSKKRRGKKSENSIGILPEKFTRRNCASRVAEVFDMLGRFTPITAGFKLDLRKLCIRNLNWDDVIPEELVPTWKENFEMVRKLGEIKFRRCIVPHDAINLDMETIEVSDCSQSLACSAIYGRFKRKNGLYSCQLIFARSKVLPKNLEGKIPRGETLAADLNASTGHVVFLALEEFIVDRISLTDSQIVMYWLNNPKLQLTPWVRNRIIEILRLTERKNWYHIDGKNNIADLGTRKGVKFSDVSENSVWVNGHEWAKREKSAFPIKSYEQIKLTQEEVKNQEKEILKSDIVDQEWINKKLSTTYSASYAILDDQVLDKVGERYRFSNYIVDPNKFRFRKVVRIVAIIFLFLRKIKMRLKRNKVVVFDGSDLPAQFKFNKDMHLVTQGVNPFPFNCRGGMVVTLSENHLNSALKYFYTKATLEVKKFVKKKKYEKISTEKNEILYYTGRILPSQLIDNEVSLSDVCIDLSMQSFCVPIIDKFSPLAFAIINEVHWYDHDAMHSGNETVLRFVQKIAYIMEGRSLVCQFRKECTRCLYLRKKCIDVAMGPISSSNLCIAPAFYFSQVDIFGPYSSYSNINKRATSKIWFVIFCCCVTGAVDIKVCEDYSTNSFVLAFIRFSCKVGYPKKLLPDAGSQLVKGCDSMVIKFSDVHSKLHEYGVLYEVCPVGAHYMHGRVERKIKHVKESFSKHLCNNRLSVIQWETLGDQVANSINNLPIALGNVTKDLENIDLITPNRLLLARNNDRCPVSTVSVSENVGKIIQKNNDIFRVWFKAWLISYVPTLMMQPKWFRSDRDPKIGDVILFLKSDKEFDKQYQFGIISDVKVSRDLKIRQIDIEYQNYNEKTKRYTTRGTREIVVIHPVGELGLIRELNLLSANSP